MITREHGTQVEAGDESLVLRCATWDEREAWVGAWLGLGLGLGLGL